MILESELETVIAKQREIELKKSDGQAVGARHIDVIPFWDWHP